MSKTDWKTTDKADDETRNEKQTQDRLNQNGNCKKNRNQKNESAASAVKRRINADGKSQQAPVKRFQSVTQRRKLKGVFGSANALISPRPFETFAACLPAVDDGVPAQRRETRGWRHWRQENGGKPLSLLTAAWTTTCSG